MEYRGFGSKIIVRLDRGEEILTELLGIYKQHNIQLATVSGIGAVNRVRIGLFEQETKEYRTKELTGSMEIVNLTGNISQKDGECYIHCHVTLTDATYHAYGGHLNEAIIGGTGELVLDIIDGRVEREHSAEVGLNLFKFL